MIGGHHPEVALQEVLLHREVLTQIGDHHLEEVTTGLEGEWTGVHHPEAETDTAHPRHHHPEIMEEDKLWTAVYPVVEIHRLEITFHQIHAIMRRPETTLHLHHVIISHPGTLVTMIVEHHPQDREIPHQGTIIL